MFRSIAYESPAAASTLEAVQHLGPVIAINNELGAVSPQTERHNAELAEITGTLLHEFGMSSDMIAAGTLGAILHDGGKLPYAHLAELPGRLSPDENQDLQQHPIEGFKLMIAGQVETSAQREAREARGPDPRWHEKLELAARLGVTSARARTIANYAAYTVISHHRWAPQNHSELNYPPFDVMQSALVEAGLPAELSTNPDANLISNLVNVVDAIHGLTITRPYHHARFAQEGVERDLTPESAADIVLSQHHIMESLVERGLTRDRIVSLFRNVAQAAERNGVEHNLTPESVRDHALAEIEPVAA